MITSPAFAGKRYAVLGLARSGLAAVEALVASGARVTAWDRQADARERGRSGTRRARRSARDRPDRLRRRGRFARRAAQHPPDRRARRAVRRAGDRRHRTVRAGPRQPAAAQGRRHHRHQRQEHHHRAGPPHPADRGRADHDGRQHRPADPGAGPAARGRGLCAGAVELPDRPDLQPRLRRGGAAQRDARSSRSVRELRGVCGKSRTRLFEMQSRSGIYGSHRLDVDSESGSSIRQRGAVRTSTASSMRTVAAQSDWPSLQGPHNAQNAGCGDASMCHELGASAGRDRARPAHLHRPPAPHGARRHPQRRDIRQRQQGDQHRQLRPRARGLSAGRQRPAHPLDRRRAAQGGRARRDRGAPRQRQGRLHHRRGRAALRRAARRAACRWCAPR